MNILVVVPARGGSKGIPKKNIKKLQDRPLIEYTLDFALQAVDKKDVCVSTDSAEIIDCVKNYGLEVPFQRPDSLATDTSSSREVLLHAIDFYESKGKSFDFVLLLQPTSPLRKLEDLKKAINFVTPEIDMVVSVKETSSNPYYVLFEENEKGYLEKCKKGNFLRRQDTPKVYEYNGSMYLIRVSSLKEKEIYEFDKVKKVVVEDLYSIDIDTPMDWLWAEFILENMSQLKT